MSQSQAINQMPSVLIVEEEKKFSRKQMKAKQYKRQKRQKDRLKWRLLKEVTSGNETIENKHLLTDQDTRLVAPMGFWHRAKAENVQRDMCLRSGGGCLAFSLAFLGILGHTQTSVCKKLNAQITEVWEERTKSCSAASEKWKRKWHNKKVMKTIEDFGIADKMWHLNTVPLALKALYGDGNFIWKRVPFVFERGKYYLLDGLLSEKYTREDGNDSEQEDCANWQEKDSTWRHTVPLLPNSSADGPSHFIGDPAITGVALINGKRIDGVGTIEILHLRHDPDNSGQFCPDENNRDCTPYLKRFFKAYEIRAPAMAIIPISSLQIRKGWEKYLETRYFVFFLLLSNIYRYLLFLFYFVVF
jgi:hypothetical protein